MMSSRERVQAALGHQEADRVPLDLGGCGVTGMHVDAVYKLRQALHLDPPGTPVKLIEPFQQLGEIESDLLDALGADLVSLGPPETIFGFRNEGWKSWTTFAGTPALVPAGFNTDLAPNGELLTYPRGDKSAPPCARMPAGGFYMDALTRQDPIDDDHLCVEDNLEEFTPITKEDLTYLKTETDRLEKSDRAIMGEFLTGFGHTNFGDIGQVPGLDLKHPRGIRAVDEWYMSLSARRDYIQELFERQCEIALQNLDKIHKVVGERVTVVVISEADFGGQQGPIISPTTYRTLFKPVHAKVNNWVHTHTTWKTFIHCCGSIWRLLDDIVDAGFDCLNPVQTSAAQMDPEALKSKYGSRVTFWGGGVDTQKVLPFGTPDEVRNMVRQRMRVFAPGGGFVFNTIHNLQAGVPTENILALYDAVAEHRNYPVS